MAAGTPTAPARAKSKKDASSSSTTMSYEEIAKLAYLLFTEGGCRHGHDLEDWLEAERRLRQRRGRV